MFRTTPLPQDSELARGFTQERLWATWERLSAWMGGIKLDSASAVVLVGAALTVYTIIAMSHRCATHPLRLRSRPLCPSAKKPNFVGSQVLPGGEVHWHVRSRSLSGLEYDKTHLGKHYPIRGGHQMLSLAPMNSALSGDERTRRYGDTGLGASRTLGTGPFRVTNGPWPSLPAGALFFFTSQISVLETFQFTLTP